MSFQWSPRKATHDDLATIVKIEKASHASPWVESHFLEEMQKPYSRFIVLTDDDTDQRLAGYIVYWLFQEECHILNLVVDALYRRKGFGKKLVEIARNEALQSNMLRLRLEVRKHNEAAIQLYQSMGFTIDHLRKSFYSNGEDAYSMTLSLVGEREGGVYEL